MQNQNLVMIRYNEPYASSFLLAKELDTEHRYMQALIKKYREDFESFGEIKTPDSLLFKSNESPRKKGGQIKEIWLNEGQALFLLVLMKNNPKVKDLKKKLVKDFLFQRKILSKMMSQKQNIEWQELRESGKIERKAETDVIKIFVEYATAQGSKSASKYYVNISNMQNKILFGVEFMKQKFENIRDVVDNFSLAALKVCDYIVEKALTEGMEKKIFYKDIFQLAKERVEEYAKALGDLNICQKLISIV